MSELLIEQVIGHVGYITLNRPKALNALNLEMVRALTTTLLRWQEDASVHAVAIRGCNKSGHFGGFCAGGDIRFFHEAALTGNPALDDFFTEEYALNHLIHTYGKPYIAFMDGVVMGGGMGISQGGTLRIVTQHTKMAMPETNIGLFPDVGGGYFLSRCPGRTGEWLALTGEVIGASAAIALGLADVWMDAGSQQAAWDALAHLEWSGSDPLPAWCQHFTNSAPVTDALPMHAINQHFTGATVQEIVHSLEATSDAWALQTAAVLRKRSPLMLHVVLEQVRRARTMSLADDLRMERDMVRHCFFTQHLERRGASSETVEGIRALAVDKDSTPQWNPPIIEAVRSDMVQPFFVSPWPPRIHPLAGLR